MLTTLHKLPYHLSNSLQEHAKHPAFLEIYSINKEHRYYLL